MVYRRKTQWIYHILKKQEHPGVTIFVSSRVFSCIWFAYFAGGYAKHRQNSGSTSSSIGGNLPQASRK